MSIEQEKLNALNQALGKIEKEFGKWISNEAWGSYINGN